GYHRIAVVADGGDRGLDRLLAHLLGDHRAALVQQLGGVGAAGVGGLARSDGVVEALQNVVVLGHCPVPRVPLLGRYYRKLRAAHNRIGRPAFAIWALACPIVNVPKWKIEAASTAVAWASRMPSTRWSRVPTPPEAITG